MRIPSSKLKPPLARHGRIITLFVDGRVITAYEGETIAAVLLAEGQRTFRRTPHGDEPRSLFCGMGVCYDCLVTVDGKVNVRACLTPVEEGMRVGTRGRRSEVGGRRSVGARDSSAEDNQGRQVDRQNQPDGERPSDSGRQSLAPAAEKETINNQQPTVNNQQKTEVAAVGARDSSAEDNQGRQIDRQNQPDGERPSDSGRQSLAPVAEKETINNQQPTVNNQQKTEVAVVGAGPAGLEAALAAAEAGAQVILIDSAPQTGGQYFRQPPDAFQVANEDGEAAALFAHLHDCRSIQILTDTLVWGAFPDGDGWLLTLHGQNAPHRLHAQTLILATGAYDRPLAFPGWTLPGVMTAGAVQTLLKSQGVLPGRRFVLAGTGPLQLVVAAQLVEAGTEVVAVLEATTFSRLRRLRHFPAVWGQWERLREGWSAWRTLQKAGVPIRFGWAMTETRGEDQVETVDITKLDDNGHPLPDSLEVIEADTLVLGYGLLPSTQLTRLLGCEHKFASRRGGWIPVRNESMQTTLPGVFAVGDGAGIGGVTLARQEGRMAGLQAAHQLGRINDQALQSVTPELRSQLKRERRFADLLGDLFTPGPGLYTLADEDTIICRCEEVRLGDIRQAQAAGCSTLAEIKGLTRVGMGNCQGRICGDLLAHALTNINPAQQEQALQNLGLFSVRPPIHPLSLQNLAESAQQSPETAGTSDAVRSS